jgi:HEAT repeat protein
MLNQAFEALKKFDFGTPLSELQAIEDAVIGAHGDSTLRSDLEARLIAALGTDISRDAKDYVCRKLAVIGSSAAVSALADLMSSEANAHLARHALERIPGPEAAAALATAVTSLNGKLKIGAIASIGARGDAAGVAALASLLQDTDAVVARAAAMSLGSIGGSEAAAALQAAAQSATGGKGFLMDALLSCAESLLRTNKVEAATAIYQSLAGDQPSRLIRLAATRGLLACAAKA